MRAVLSFQSITATADASGDYSESASTAVNVPGDLVMLQGYKKHMRICLSLTIFQRGWITNLRNDYE